jgi:biopolymer transport protein ExbD
MIDLERQLGQWQRRDNMVSAINVIFLLLLFFMVAGNFSERFAKDVFPPRSVSTTLLVPAVEEFMLAPDTGLQFDGRAITVASWRARLSSEGVPVPAVVRLRADARAPVGQIVPLLDAFREAGVARVGLVTVRTQDGSAAHRP